jgi:hypothetical protein
VTDAELLIVLEAPESDEERVALLSAGEARALARSPAVIPVTYFSEHPAALGR